MIWTDDEIRKFLKHFDGVLLDPVNYPQQFEYYKRLWKLYKEMNNG